MKVSIKGTIALLVVGIAVAVAYKSVQVLNIDDDLPRQVHGEAMLLDVRTAVEFDDEHIDGAVNVPLGKLRTDYVRLDPNRTYVIYCSHGLRSIKAAGILKEAGFRHVLNGGPMSAVEALRRSPN